MKNNHLTLDRKGIIAALVIAQLMVIVPLMPQLPLWVSVASSIAVIWRWAAIKRHWGLPNKWLRLLLGMVGVAGIIIQHKALFSKEAGLSLFVLMTSFRLLELFRYRDGMNSLFLNLFLLSINFLYSHSILMAVYATLVAMWIFMTMNGLQRIDGMMSLTAGLGQTFKILLIALPMTIIMFVFFPRLSHPLWQISDRHSSGSGVGDSMAPGDISSLTLDDSIAFRIRFYSRHPAINQLYFRGLVLSKFDGLTWSRAKVRNYGSLRHRGLPVIYEIMLEPHHNRWLFYLDMPQKSAMTEYLKPRQNEQFVNELPYKLNKRLMYQGQSFTDYIANETLTEDEKSQYLQLPQQGNPEIRRWVQDLRSKIPDNENFINRILHLIHEQPFYYTLTPPILAEDGMDDFWFNTKRGFCEHYASVMTFIARSAGIPARIVIGYQGAQANPFSDDFIVRQSNAHAWTEIWFKNKGWVRIDPTAAIAPSRVEKNASSSYRQRESLFDPAVLAGWMADEGVFSQLGLLWDAANSRWQEWVIGFNRDSQIELLKFAGFDGFSWRVLLRGMILFSALVLILWSFSLIPEKKPEPPMVKLYRKWCQRLAQLGFAKRSNEGPKEFWSRINQQNEALGQRSKAFIEAYIEFRFAGKDYNPEKINLFRKILFQKK